MPSGLDFAHLDLRGALDFAIGIEEEAQLRYQEFATIVTDAGAARFFTDMVASEARHRRALESRRENLFGNGPRFDSSLVGHSEGADPLEDPPAVSAREAMQLALDAETRAVDFYTATLPHLRDPDVRTLFEHLQAEERQHRAAVQRMLDALAA